MMMDERIVPQLIGDIDGSEILDGAGERVVFSLRGTGYQIDLSNSNLAKFRESAEAVCGGWR